MAIDVVELFAGVGGFRIGLEMASDSFKTIWANQWEPRTKVQHAYQCYVTHFDDNSCINEDISMCKNKVPDHTLLCGGFPCQDYSVAATGAKGIEGKKGVLWWQIYDIIENKKPKYILLENVDRLLKSPASQRGRDFAIILKTLSKLGYAVEWRVINAAQYGHVQRRRRVFIFAYHKTTDFYKQLKNANKAKIILSDGFFARAYHVEEEAVKTKEFTLNMHKKLEDFSKEYSEQFYNSGFCVNGVGATMETVPLTGKHKKVLSDIIEKRIGDEYYLTSAQIEKFKYMRGAKKILRTKPNGQKYYYSEGSMSDYDSLELPARTMLTSEGGLNRSTHIIVQKNKNIGKLRFLTPVECERLNGFPDNWTNTGMPHRFRYFCMGNALVVPLIRRFGEVLSEIENKR